MKTRIITSVVGLCFLALVLSMFNTIEEMDIAAEEIAAQLAFLRRFKRR